ncbi:MAG: hypothetical protein Q9217_000732 [Psora testacea]
MAAQYQIPNTPRVISPTPTPTENQNNSYFAPITRSATAKRRSSPSSSAIDEDSEPDSTSDSSLEQRARAPSRSPKTAGAAAVKRRNSTIASKPSKPQSADLAEHPPERPQINGHLSPSSALPGSSTYWRDISRSPSPLGLIPIHRHWRSIIHRHEIPRKALHLSIGFFTLHLYSRGTTTASIHPWLLGALVPIASLDYARHAFPGLNRLYIKCVGALMRESEVDGYNGVIWYLLGAWTVLRFFPKDIGVMSVLLLSWCDTAASTVGRLYGRYTPRIRRGKSLAGSAAAAAVGALTAGLFWGLVVPSCGLGDEGFMFRGQLGLPELIKAGAGMTGEEQGKAGGWVALGIVSLWSGFVASASEVVDLFGLDDNATIPILSGLGLWGFFKAFAT